MLFFYKTYKYSPGATVLSAMASVFGTVMVIVGIAAFANSEVLGGILLVIAGGLIFYFCSRVLPDKVAEKAGIKNIHTKPKYAYLFCQDHPEYYEQLAREIPAFAEKYEKDPVSGKVVKRKKVK